MPKKDNIKFFIVEIFFKPPKKNYETNKIIYYHFDEIWSIDSAYFSDYKKSNNKRFRNLYVIKDDFSKYLWDLPLKKKQTKTQDFSNIPTQSKRHPLKIESDRGAEFYNSIIQNF